MTLFELMARITLDTSEYDSALGVASRKTSDFASKVRGGIGKAAKVGAMAMAAVGTATIATGAAITKATGKVAEYGDNIDKMSQKMGISAEKYQEWDAVMKHSGTSMETMKAGMKTLANAAEKGNKAFERIGLTQDEISKMSQEELFEATIKGLQGVEDTTERTYLSGQLLGRGATELGALLNTSAEDTQKMRDRVRELGGVMSNDAVKASAKYQDTLQDMKTSMAGLSRGIISQFLPSVTTVMEGLTDIFAGGNGAGKVTDGINQIIKTVTTTAPKFASVVATVGSSIISAIGSNLPTITNAITNGAISAVSGLVSSIPSFISAAESIIGTIISVISSSVPKIGKSLLDAIPNIQTQLMDIFKGIDFVSIATDLASGFMSAFSVFSTQILPLGTEFIKSISEGFVEGIPDLLSNILPMFLQFTEYVRSNAGMLVDAGLEFITNLAQGIINSFPLLVQYVPDIITNIAGVINDNAPKILATGVNIVKNLVSGIVKAVPIIVSNLPKIIAAIWNVFTATNWINIGTTIINGIVGGVKALANYLPDALGNIGSSAMNFLKGIQWGSLGSSIMNSIVTGVKAIGSKLPSALISIGKAAINAFKGVNWVSVGKTVITLLSGAIRGAGKLIITVLKTIGKTAINGFKAINWKGVGKAVITFIGNAIKGAGRLVLTALKTAGTNAMNAFKSINWAQLGSNIISGIVRGIGGAASSLFGKLRNLASDALGAAKKALGINSPSKLFRDVIGKGITEGWALGIDQGSIYVERAMDRLNDMATSNMPEYQVGFAEPASLPAIASPSDEPYATIDLPSEPTEEGRRIITFNNYVTVNGADDPEDWAERLVRGIRQETRMA